MRSPARLSIQGKDYRAEDSDPPDQVERRTRLRFPFELRVRFRTVGQAILLPERAGSEISASGVLVMYQHEVSAGTRWK